MSVTINREETATLTKEQEDLFNRLGDCYFDACDLGLRHTADLISDAENMIVTFGSEKVVYKDRLYLPPKVDAHDVCGAGDTFLAALVYEYLQTNSIEKAIEFAIKASAVTVQHVGVYAPRIGEICNAA